MRLAVKRQGIYGMARVGWVPLGEKNNMEVYVHTDDVGKTPHFHFRKYGNKNNFDWEVCIRYDSPEYFDHGRYSGQRIKTKTAEELDKMLRSVNPKSRGLMYWQTAVDAWNNDNSDELLDIDIEQPDYTELNR